MLLKNYQFNKVRDTQNIYFVNTFYKIYKKTMLKYSHCIQ